MVRWNAGTEHVKTHHRRTFLEYLSAVMLTSVVSGSQEAGRMWGTIAKITLLPSRRDVMIEILKESAADMPGCLSNVVAKDVTDENTIWVTEVWHSMASHDASLSLPAVKNAIPRSKAIASNFEKIVVTSPAWELGCQWLTPTNRRTSDGQTGENPIGEGFPIRPYRDFP